MRHRRLDRIVNQIIDYARPRELAPVVFTFVDILHEVLKLLDASIAAKRHCRQDRAASHAAATPSGPRSIETSLAQCRSERDRSDGHTGTLTIAGI